MLFCNISRKIALSLLFLAEYIRSWDQCLNSFMTEAGTGFYMLTASVMKELKEIRGVWKRQNILLHQLVQVKATSGEVHDYALSLLWRTSLLYRNQPINLLGKSMEQFLYDRDLRHKRVYKSVLIKLFHIWLQQTKRNIPMLFVRGDGVILISPSLRVGV